MHVQYDASVIFFRSDYTKRQPSVTVPAWPSTLIKNLLLAMQRDACLLDKLSFIFF